MTLVGSCRPAGPGDALLLGGGPRLDSRCPHPTTAPAWLWDTGDVPLLGQSTGTPAPRGPLARSDAGAEGKASQHSAAAAPRHGGGRSPTHQGRTVPGSKQHLEHGHPSPGLYGPAQPRLTHRQEGPPSPGRPWPASPSPAAAVTHFQSQRGRRQRCGGLPPALPQRLHPGDPHRLPGHTP